MTRYIIKAYHEVEKDEFNEFLRHLSEEHGVPIWERPEDGVTSYLLELEGGILEEIAKEINQD